MPKVTAADIIARGFRGEQFGLTPGDAVAFAAYLDPLLEDAGTWASHQYGAAYASALHLDALRLKNAEAEWVTAELWRRRIAFVDGNAAFALENDERATVYAKLASEAAASAETWLLLASTATGTLGSSIGGVVVESGRHVSTTSRTQVLA